MTTINLTRSIAGIENRTAQEVFDIMVDRIRRSHPSPSASEAQVRVEDDDYVIPTSQIIGELRTIANVFDVRQERIAAAVCRDAADRLSLSTPEQGVTPPSPQTHVRGMEAAIRRAGTKARDELLERVADGGTVDNDLADYMTRIVDACVNAALASEGQAE